MITRAADVEDVKAAVMAFGLGDLVSAPEAVAQAWSNAVVRVDTTQGSFAIKLFDPSMPQAQQRRLHRGMTLERHVLDTDLLPVPQPVPPHDDWLVTLPHNDETRYARCHEWITGIPAHSPLPPVLLEQAGTYLGRLHSLRQLSGDTSQIQELDLDRWTRAARAAIQLNLPFAVQLADLTPLIQSLNGDLDELRRQRRPMRLSHNDYDPKNAIISDAGPLVITDWDYAGPVLAEVELIVAATSFTETDDNVRSFVRAYRAAGGEAVHADELAMTAELADVDWLLRNVEAFTQPADADTVADRDTVSTLISNLPVEVHNLRAWPQRLNNALKADLDARHTGRTR